MSVPPVAAQGGQLVPRGSVVFDLEIHDAEGYAALPPRWPGEHFWLPATSPKAPKVL
jgi:hypothetical protein